jgi:endoglucanase
LAFFANRRRFWDRTPWLVPALTTALAACQATAPKPGPQSAAHALPKPPAPLLGHNLLLNGSLDEGSRSLPWTASFSEPAAGRTFVEKGEVCIEVKNKGLNRWDAYLRQQNLILQKGHKYAVQFKIHSSQKTRAYLKIGQAGPPYHELGGKLILELDTAPQVVSNVFTMLADDDAGVELAIHLGGQLAKAAVPFTVCVDDARLDDPEYVEKPEQRGPPIPGVLVNQVGYFPHLAKIATVKTPNAVPWQLVNAGNQVVASGTTIPFGLDKASGDQVSIADFSSFTGEGDGFTIKAGGAVSHPFDIRNDLYRKLRYDALAYFYQTRSGIPIVMPYAGGEQWVRPAGHIGVPPNKGDTRVPCWPGTGCAYFLDVSGGWYDAGDQGKYVVNAGITVWTLLNLWERTKYLGAPAASAADFADGKMNIPENKNGVPDLLDEVRWEVEWELKMQVPEGEKLAGMAHHKIHDFKWAPDTMAPHDDPTERYLLPPSTAATLNLAANAAQASRVWRTIDKAFAERCLVAAERAWLAALANPAILVAKGGPAGGAFPGGGSFDDDKVGDDFYWAASELFITTKKKEYRTYLTKSDQFKRVEADWTDDGEMFTSMTWADTQTLGSVSLAIVPNGLDAADVAEIRKKIVERGDLYLGLIPKGGYRLPFGVPDRGYPWGSTSFVVNNALMIALAYDFSHDVKYVNGVAMGMDYILGRNALDQSYITGYGDRPLENPYHRFWCYQANHKYPKPPPGIMSGGANSELQDPWVQAAGIQPCAPQKCFYDIQGAWSVNEVDINWNAPLAWITAFLDEQASVKRDVRVATKPAPTPPAPPPR